MSRTVQWMDDGRSGVSGLPAASHVMVVRRSDNDCVNPRSIVVDLAWGTPVRSNRATASLVIDFQ